MRLGGQVIYKLAIKAHRYGHSTGLLQETVVIASAPATSVAFAVKGNTWNYDKVKNRWVDNLVISGFQDIETPQL